MSNCVFVRSVVCQIHQKHKFAMDAKMLLCLVVCANARPLNEDAADIDKAVKDLKFVSYLENFKNTMADYVNSEYNHLTFNDKEKVEAALEEFLLDFSKDLTEILTLKEDGNHITKAKPNQADNTIDHAKVKLNDGVSESTAEEIKTTLIREFPDIGEEEANEIVYRIRLNLLATRQKLDEIIEQSKAALAINS